MVVLIWMDQSIFPVGVAVDGPDGSFQTAFEVFFKQGSRAGHDWVYTYGPLGFIENFTYDPDLFLGRLIFADVMWRALCAAVLVLAFLRNPSTIERALAVVVLLLLPLNPDAYIYLFTLAAAEICIHRPHSRALLITAVLVLVPASLAKFTSFGLLVPCVIAILLARSEKGRPRDALVFVGGTALFWLALWIVVCRQSLFDIPAFLWHSFDMASAYAKSMGSECQPELQTRAFWVLGLLFATFLLPALNRPGRVGKFAPALIRLFVLAAVFKAGVVRGADHTMILFTFAAVAPFTIIADFTPGSKLRIAHLGLKLTTLLVAWFGALDSFAIQPPVMTNLARSSGESIDWAVRMATDLKATREQCEFQLAQARSRRALPRTRATVGQDTIDIHPPFQDSIVFNDLNWRPRPVFQSYATLSENLIQLNRKFFDSDRAPQWFLLMPRAIDGRLQTMEDAAALQIIVRDYRPVLQEAEMLLLKRVPQPASSEPNEVVIDRELRFGERLDLSGLGPHMHLLQLEADSTLRGRLHALALRPVPIHAVVSTSSGREVAVQLIPSMLESGAIVDPLLVDTLDWVRFYAGRNDRTVGLTLMPSARPWAYPETLRVRILRSPIKPAHVDIDQEWSARFSTFETIPDDYRALSPLAPRVESGTDVLYVGTPSVIRFRVARGHHKVSGALGVLAEAYEQGASDGVTFLAYYALDAVTHRLQFERTLDPRSRIADRGVIAFEFEFDAESSGELVLCTQPGPQRDFVDDAAFWTRIRIE
ncbi:MAG: hypothetical protein JNL28_01875 [Planctomycetes bacterium]|nr:hypothetical protein [Planctomycetota bacterium]